MGIGLKIDINGKLRKDHYYEKVCIISLVALLGGLISVGVYRVFDKKTDESSVYPIAQQAPSQVYNTSYLPTYAVPEMSPILLMLPI